MYLSQRCCELLQNVYLCISTYNFTNFWGCGSLVVNCFKMCIFALARTTDSRKQLRFISCELLQNVYLCISTYNKLPFVSSLYTVVNCFKMCIFALARTTLSLPWFARMCCELLQNVYLCISTYNASEKDNTYRTVVNCFKMCIFALARTTSFH